MNKKILYHATPVESLESILEEGILSKRPLKNDKRLLPRVYLTDDPFTWINKFKDDKRFKNGMVIFRIDLEWEEWRDLIGKGEILDHDHCQYTAGLPAEIWWATEKIPPEKIVAYYVLDAKGRLIDAKYRTKYFDEMKNVDIGQKGW